jgi:large subunit ribosomal protein L22
LQRGILSSASGVRNPLQWLRDNLATGTRRKRSKEDIDAARQQQIAEGKESVFDALPLEGGEATPTKQTHSEVRLEYLRFSYSHIISLQHKYSTANFRISPRKLNMLGRQVAGKPIDHAILQMAFSEKRASKRIKSMLALARDHAVNYKGLDKSRLIVGVCYQYLSSSEF